MTRRVGVIINPERAALGDDVVRHLRDHGCEVTTVEPGSPDGMSDAIDELVDNGIDVLAAVGGDGTQRTAAAQLLGTDVALVVVPGGTVNLLAAVLDVATIERAALAAATGRQRMIDVGRIDGEVFVLNASTGWDAAVIERVDDSAKRFGRLGFVVAGIQEWRRSEPRRVTVSLDGEQWFDETALSVLVMNVGQRASESLHVAPDAALDDGKLDVLVLRRHSVTGLLRVAWAIVRGRDTPHRDMVAAQAVSIDVEWECEVAVQRDGDELPAATRTTYRSEPACLRVMVPDS